MPSCIFCDGALGPETKPEHILLNAVGGRMTTTQVDCSDCNNMFGGGIDKAFADQVTEIRNLLQLESGTGRTAPSLKNVKAGDQVLNLWGDGQIDLVRKPFATSKNADGSLAISINARSAEEIERLTPHIAASIPMPEEKLREQIGASVASIIEQRPNMIHFPLSFGGGDAFRSAAKSCLVLWATSVGNEKASGEPYRAAREFVMHGGEAFYLASTKLDTRLLPVLDQVKAAYGPIFNLIHVQSDTTGRVVGHFTLYNLIAFQVVLAAAGATPDHKITLVSNPERPEIWSSTVGLDLPVAWLATPEYEVGDARERIASLISYYTESGRSGEFERIIRDVLEKNGLREGDRIPQELAHKICGEIAHRAAMHQFGLPFEEKVMVSDLLARHQRPKDTDGAE
ncbi:HNH endonuclease [Bradyrhizobium sp. NC92]|nr:HNH endonuclease [Bradyrhizobium sp. NC92]